MAFGCGSDDLRGLALGDSSEEVRRLALESYADHSDVAVKDVKAVLASASADPSAIVRETAERIGRALEDGAP